MKQGHRTSVILTISIIALCISIGSCDSDGLFLTNGQTSADIWDLDSGDIDEGDEWDEGNDSTPFLSKVQNNLWECTQTYSNEVGCAEAGCYIYKNKKTGQEKMGTVAYGKINTGTIVPGSSDPAKNGMTGSDWEVTGYVHTHTPFGCLPENTRREVGPSINDVDWANTYGIPVYTIDYQGTYNKENNKYYLYNDGKHTYADTYMWVSYPE